MTIQEAIQVIDNTLAQVQTNRQNHAVLQQALQIVVAALNAGEEAQKQVTDVSKPKTVPFPTGQSEKQE